MEYAGRDKQNLSLWRCRCNCGKKIVTRASSLTTGITTSCGCYQREIARKNKLTHGMSGGMKPSRIYSIWRNMKQRCSNPNASKYELYGGRGIIVCDEWVNFESFYKWAMSNGYSDNLSIDRKNSDGNYEPDNCQWVTVKQQNLNKRDNRLITYNGITLTLTEWSVRIGLKYSALKSRLDQHGWSIEEALTLPKNTKVRYKRAIN